jgi:DNA-binding SARP family transcriptional activator
MKAAKKSKIGLGVNAALFCNPSDTRLVTASLAKWLNQPGCYLMTVDEELLTSVDSKRRLPLAGGLHKAPETASDLVLADLDAQLQKYSDISCLIIDMSWSVNAIWGASIIERWGGIVHQVAEARGIVVVSLYDRETLVEDQLAATFRAHKAFLSPSGLYDNPHWLPHALVANATLEEQLGFLLGQLVPEFANVNFHSAQFPDLARGATPSWVRRTRHGIASEAANIRWHIHCLGQLRVYINGNELANWALQGSAPKKSRALFAFLLNRSDTWCHADQLSEFLWPHGGTEDSKRARLRHTVTMLRKTLGGKDAISRSGEYYRLNVPEGSWIDIRAFEQLCRRGLALFKGKDYSAAIRVYEAAERLYTGELFEDLPIEYVQSEFDDWCIPKRIWLRDMAVKLYFDMSKVLRHQGRLREALDRGQKSVHLDPTNEAANIEILRCLEAQGRYEAITRQFHQYKKTVIEIDGGEPSPEVQEIYRKLMVEQ